ncbi:MAG: hypothetical protein LRY40_00435, partial [Shewanella fodinae]|nr:hypothetical protein [Shewanella fodinae]
DFVSDFFPNLQRYDKDAIAEFSSLLQRVFGAGSVLPLPDYMFWRRPALGAVLKPTLVRLMGQQRLNIGYNSNACGHKAHRRFR